jgi:hypothetical protein
MYTASLILIWLTGLGLTIQLGDEANTTYVALLVATGFFGLIAFLAWCDGKLKNG